MFTEPDQIEAVRQILIQLYSLSDKKFPDNRIGRVEREAIFFLYEGLDKYSDDKPHSASARALRRANGGKLPAKSVTYDHAIPLASLREEMKRSVTSFELMKAFLRRFIRGVVITRDEDSLLNKSGLRRRLPDGAEPHDTLARYRAVGIKFEDGDEDLLRN